MGGTQNLATAQFFCHITRPKILEETLELRNKQLILHVYEILATLFLHELL